MIYNAEGNAVGTYKQSTSLIGHHTSKFFHVSADLQKDWVNGIFHNSRYGIFSLQMEKGKLKLELISNGLDTPKFRKATVKTESAAINKVLQWLSDIREESVFLGALWSTTRGHTSPHLRRGFFIACPFL